MNYWRLGRWSWLLAAALSIGGASSLRAQPVVAGENINRPARPRNRTGTRMLESTVTRVEIVDGATRLTLREGAMTISLKPATELVREERGVGASELKSGDTLSLLVFKAHGRWKGPATVASIAPLTIRVGEAATLTVHQVEEWSFDRYAPMRAAELAVGQTVALQIRVGRDGGIDARRVAVVIVREKAARKPRRSRKPSANAATKE